MASRRDFNRVLLSGLVISTFPEWVTAKNLAVASATEPAFRLSGGVWHVRPMAPRGKGISSYSKHTRLAVNPLNGKVYICGGDYEGPEYLNSGRQELYSYDIPTDRWKLEYPYCAKVGEVNPHHPDQVGWTWDNKRNVLWMVPGTQYGPATCPGVGGRVMSFDPQAGKWAVPEQENLPDGFQASKFAQYDEVTDTVICFFDEGGKHWSPLTGKWQIARFGGNRTIANNYNVKVGRHIYLLDSRRSADNSHVPQLCRYDIDDRRIEDVEKLPFDPGVPELTNFVWDSRKHVFLFAKFASHEFFTPELWLYFPDEKRWEHRNVEIPGIQSPYSNALVYHEPGGLVMFMGGEGDRNPHIYLYGI